MSLAGSFSFQFEFRISAHKVGFSVSKSITLNGTCRPFLLCTIIVKIATMTFNRCYEKAVHLCGRIVLLVFIFLRIWKKFLIVGVEKQFIDDDIVDLS